MNKEKQYICPKCKKTMYPFKLGYACSNRRCTFWIPREIRQKVLTEDSIQELITNKETGIIHGFHKRGYSQTFAASLYITNAWKIKLRLADETGLSCPQCSGMLIRFKRGYKCVHEEACGYVLWNQFGGKELTEEQMHKLLTEKQTDTIKGFISRKNGKKYAARIVMGKRGVLRMEFENKEEKRD